MSKKYSAINAQEFEEAANLREQETELRELIRALNVPRREEDSSSPPPHQRLIRLLVTRIRELQSHVVTLEQQLESK